MFWGGYSVNFHVSCRLFYLCSSILSFQLLPFLLLFPGSRVPTNRFYCTNELLIESTAPRCPLLYAPPWYRLPLLPCTADIVFDNASWKKNCFFFSFLFFFFVSASTRAWLSQVYQIYQICSCRTLSRDVHCTFTWIVEREITFIDFLATPLFPNKRKDWY